MGAVIALLAAQKDKRSALKHARVHDSPAMLEDGRGPI